MSGADAAQHLGLVYGVAGEMVRKGHLRRHPGLAWEDLLAWGTIGLMRALERFDPSRGLAFTALAFPSIRGAILDGLRAERGGRPRTERGRLARDIVPLAALPVHSAALQATGRGPDGHAEAAEVRSAVHRALGRLGERERGVLVRVDLQGERQDEVAREMGLTPGRISQIRRAALARLRDDPELRAHGLKPS